MSRDELEITIYPSKLRELLSEAELQGARKAQAEIDRLRAGEDSSEPDPADQWTAARLWHLLLESSVMRRHYVLEKLLIAQDDANRCFLEGHQRVDP